MSKSLYVYRSNRVIKIKDGIDLEYPQEKNQYILLSSILTLSFVRLVPPQNVHNGKMGRKWHCTRYRGWQG